MTTDIPKLRALLANAMSRPWTETVLDDGSAEWNSDDGAVASVGAICMDDAEAALAVVNVADELLDEVERLREMVRRVAPWLNPDATERFDQFAEEFYRETGVMAPGKSAPMEMGASQPPDDVRRDQYQKWHRARLLSLHEEACAVLGGDDNAE